jgi:hypothetical protein
MKKFTAILIILTAITATAFSIENAPLGEISRTEGKVKIYKNKEVRGKDVVETNVQLFTDDKIKTGRDSKAYITMKDASRVVVLERSVLSMDGFTKLTPEDGKVVFNISKIDRAEGVQIGLQTAVIGVKGTTFLVEVGKGVDDLGTPEVKVYLKEGELSFTSIQGEFKKYAEQVKEEYSNFVNETMSDYDRFIREMQDEKYEYVKEFEIKGGTAVSIDGKEVKNIEFTDDVNDAFGELERF